MMETAGACPTVGAAEDRRVAGGHRITRRNSPRREIQRLIPGQLDKGVVTGVRLRSRFSSQGRGRTEEGRRDAGCPDRAHALSQPRPMVDGCGSSGSGFRLTPSASPSTDIGSPVGGSVAHLSWPSASRQASTHFPQRVGRCGLHVSAGCRQADIRHHRHTSHASPARDRHSFHHRGSGRSGSPKPSDARQALGDGGGTPPPRSRSGPPTLGKIEISAPARRCSTPNITAWVKPSVSDST